MKVKIENKYIQIGLTFFLTAIAIIAVYFSILRFDAIKVAFSDFGKKMMPVTIGLIMAYLMTPLLNAIENKIVGALFDKNKWIADRTNRKKHVRRISVFITLVIVAALLYLFFKTIIPEVYASIEKIIRNFPGYTGNLIDWLEKVTSSYPDVSKVLSQIVLNASEETGDFLNDMALPAVQKFLLPNVNNWLLGITSSIIKLIKVLWNILIGIIISIYVLNGKEKVVQRGTKFCYAVFERSTANKVVDGIRYVHRTFIGFLAGKVLDSFIIGIICYISLLIMKIQYPSLIALIVGVTNIIPYFGPFLGAIPSAIILLMVEPKQALYFLIFILILQQFDGNILGPKILSGSTGITSFWIIFAITLFGGWFGIIGMVIGVPLMAIIISFIRHIMQKQLEKKKLPIDSANYTDVDEITEEGEFIKYRVALANSLPKKKSLTAKIFIGIWNLLKRFGKWLWSCILKITYKIKKAFRKNK